MSIFVETYPTGFDSQPHLWCPEPHGGEIDSRVTLVGVAFLTCHVSSTLVYLRSSAGTGRDCRQMGFLG